MKLTLSEILTCTVASPLPYPVLTTRSSLRDTWKGDEKPCFLFLFNDEGGQNNEKSSWTPARFLSQSCCEIKWIRTVKILCTQTQKVLEIPLSPLHVNMMSEISWVSQWYQHIRSYFWLHLHLYMVMIKLDLHLFVNAFQCLMMAVSSTSHWSLFNKRLGTPPRPLAPHLNLPNP